MKKVNRNIRAITAVLAVFVVLAAAAAVITAVTATNAPAEITDPLQPSKTENTAETGNMAAMWISYLEFQSVDFSSEAVFTAQIEQMFDNCSSIGLNTLIVQVRPFGDALYNSSVYPTSHLITGVQGDVLPFDPLEIMTETAHSRNLGIEAWVNPYRVQLNSKNPGNISADNPANNTDLVFNTQGGIYYNPCLAEVQDMVVKGIEEIVLNYDVDGIHLDDYFYPSTDLSLDEEYYKEHGGSLSHEDWRRENVNTLIKRIYSTVKAADSTVTVGISPQGNNDNNYNVQYSDVKLWLSQPGYADYIMPQLYWGFDYLTASGADYFGFARLCEEWASYPRCSSVKLHIGLGAYRIGDGDGGANDQSEWNRGDNLKRMVEKINSTQGAEGFALYRYDFLFKNSSYPDLAQQECENIKAVLKLKQ